MKYLSRCGAAIFTLSLIAISTGPAPAVIQPMWGGGGGGNNLAGMYSGSVTDSVLGTGTAAANVVESGIFGGGDPYGGWFNFTFGSTTYSNGMSAERNTTNHQHGHRYDDGNGHTGIHGVFVSIIGSSACTFTFKANFNPSSFQMSGEYQARTGCTGESGTFLFSQQCYYQETGSGSGSVRRNTSGSGPGACS